MWVTIRTKATEHPPRSPALPCAANEAELPDGPRLTVGEHEPKLTGSLWNRREGLGPLIGRRHRPEPFLSRLLDQQRHVS